MLANREALEREVREIQRKLLMSPFWDIPPEITVEDEPISSGYRSGVREDGQRLIFSGRLGSRIRQAVKREAFRLFIPPKFLRAVPETMDLAWAYSLGSLGWWRENTHVVKVSSLPLYDAPSLLGILPARQRLITVKQAVHLMAAAEELTDKVSFSLYFRILLASLSDTKPHLSRRGMAVLRILARNPDLLVSDVSRETGISQPTVSRTIKKLRYGEMVSGPWHVNFPALGLETVVCELPSRRLVEDFASSKLTYSILWTVSSRSPSYAIVLVPRRLVFPLIEGLESLDIRVGVVKRQGYFFRLDRIEVPDLGRRLSAALRGPARLRPISPKETVARKRLSREDMRLLARIHRTGSISESSLVEEGFRGVRYKIRKFRDGGVIYRSYSPTGRFFGEPTLIHVEVGESEFGLMLNALAAISSPVLAYLEGSLRGAWGPVFVSPESGLRMARMLSALLGERLTTFQPILTGLESHWEIPWELWDEERQEFSLGGELSRLLTSLALLLRS